MALLTPVSSLPTRAAPRSAATPPSPPATTELRLAVVCDGGVSLAIYEHGVTKELQNLVIASRAFDEAASKVKSRPEARAGLKGPQQSYFDALATLADGGKPLSVVIDIISGTSAGGINGVCLAKGLAHNLSQDPLTDVWMERADLAKLAHRRLPTLRGALLNTLVVLPFRINDNWSPLHGDLMSQWLVEALDAMDAAPVDKSHDTLMPANHDLDLFVTATDLRGYQRIVPSPDGGKGEYDRVNRKVFHFTSASSNGFTRFGPSENPGLAFAARCTSSFPGAFAPNSLDGFARVVAKHSKTKFDTGAFITDHLGEYVLANESALTTHFADGGVLNNSPFDHVVTAVSAKNAQSQVDRRIVHIDPSPGAWPAVGAADQVAPSAATPTYVSGLRASLSARSSQSRVSDLLNIQVLNGTIGQVGRIAINLQDTVYKYLQEVAKQHETALPTWDQAASWSDEVHAKVPEVAGQWNVETYQRLKISVIAEMIAGDLADALGYPGEVQQADFLRSIFAAWFNGDGFWTDDLTPDDLKAFLNATDMPYKERRLRFLIAGVSRLYADPEFGGDRAQSLNALKASGWTVLSELIAFRRDAARTVAATSAAFLDPQHLIGAEPYENPARFTADHAGDIKTLVTAYITALSTYRSDSAKNLWTTFLQYTEGWTPRTKADLLYRYLGYPLWDALTYPVIALSQLPQLSPIQLTRFSPRDTDLLYAVDANGTARAKLKGTAIHHFGGFLDRSWRENDYLWGRLDAVALILDMLGQSGWTPPTHSAFSAVLDQESSKLATLKPLVSAIRKQLADNVIEA